LSCLEIRQRTLADFSGFVRGHSPETQEILRYPVGGSGIVTLRLIPK
jgi:hypothetical protein